MIKIKLVREGLLLMELAFNEPKIIVERLIDSNAVFSSFCCPLSEGSNCCLVLVHRHALTIREVKKNKSEGLLKNGCGFVEGGCVRECSKIVAEGWLFLLFIGYLLLVFHSDCEKDIRK